MNSTVYIYGKLSSGYSQYPEDYTKSIFQYLYLNAKTITQIAIHRDRDMMYYCYIRKFGVGNYIGFCVLLNDLMLATVDNLFLLFENVVSNMLSNGYLIRFDENGNIIPNAASLYLNQEAISLITESIKVGFDRLESTSRKLPPMNFAIKKDTLKEYSLQNNHDEIIKSTYQNGYTYIYKSKEFDTLQMNSYRGVLSRITKENKELKKQCQSLKFRNTSLLNKQRNTKWVGILSVAIAILGMILYFKVLNPSEVTHFETKNFIYYGPIKNHKPDGIGVAIYPTNDPDGRKYYIGKFVNGMRQDTAAFLFYQDGDYYYGSMTDDKWKGGILYMNSDNSHFKGTFKENKPYNGTWYDHREVYKLVDGEKYY